MSDTLPIIVPFFGAVLLISVSGLCCLKRQFQRQYEELGERIFEIDKNIRTLRQINEPQTNIPIQPTAPVYTPVMNYPTPYISYPNTYPQQYMYQQDPMNIAKSV